jgi:hypothetical protein
MLITHNIPVGLAFYNDRVKEIIAADIIAEPFTYVPPLAGHMELVGGNALVFGKITEGYDVIDIDVKSILANVDYSLLNPSIAHAVSIKGGSTGVVTPDYLKWDDATEYHKDDLVTVWTSNGIITTNPDGEINYYRCKTTAPIGTPPTYGVSDTYWNFLPRNALYSFRRIHASASIVIPWEVVVGSTFNITVKNTEEGIPSTTASYTVQEGDNGITVWTAMIAECVAQGFEIVTYDLATRTIDIYYRYKYYMVTPVYEAGDINTVLKDFTFDFYVLAYGNTMTFPILKCGAKHQFGIVYKDRGGRACSVIKSDDLSVYIPFYAEPTIYPLGSVFALTFKIYHKPPTWAESYEIVYFGNVSMDYWLQLRANNITGIPTSSGNRFSLNIQETLDWTRNNNNRWKVSDYVWQAGDRLRLLATINELSGTTYGLYSGEAIGDDFSSSPYDYEIEATGTQYNEEAIGGDWLIFQAVERPVLFEDQTNILVEVYRPRKGLAQMVAYGTGMAFEIGTDENGNRYHKGDVDQVFGSTGAVTPAEVINTANDAWKYYRLNYKFESTIIQPFWAESIFPSDWWSNQIIANKLTSCGFPFLDDLSQRQTVLDERIRHGGYLITGTRTNNIAHFTFNDYMDFPKKNGDINGLREVGFTLKVIQMYKEVSVYINRIQTFNPDGTEQFTLTDKFLAEQRPMEADYGCQHPDSIMVNGRNLYYWDNSQGVFIRSSPNGQVVLDIKMKRWFKDLVRWIQTRGGREALQTRTGANNDHDEIWVTFRAGSETRGLIFSEKSGRYISEIDQPTESYVHLGNFFAHIYRQCVWFMNIDEGQDYLSWSGEPTYAEVEVVSNVEPNKNKIFNAIAVFADHLLQSLSKSVVIPAEASAVNEIMESNIPIFERKEGVYFGKIMKDENSKGNFLTLLARKLNGREMRGRYCFVKLRTVEHDEKVRIDSIVVFSTPSERNI